MTHFIYPDSPEPWRGPPLRREDLDAKKGWLKHYSNWCWLDHVTKISPDWRDRQQANKELETCRRKLDWWQAHPSWTPQLVDEDKRKMDMLWESARAAARGEV